MLFALQSVMRERRPCVDQGSTWSSSWWHEHVITDLQYMSVYAVPDWTTSWSWSGTVPLGGGRAVGLPVTVLRLVGSLDGLGKLFLALSWHSGSHYFYISNVSRIAAGGMISWNASDSSTGNDQSPTFGSKSFDCFPKGITGWWYTSKVRKVVALFVTRHCRIACAPEKKNNEKTW